MKAACIQINSSNDIAENIEKASGLIRQAVVAGAEFIALPENVAIMAESAADLHDNSFIAEEHPAHQAFCELAKELNIWLLIGSLAVHAHDAQGKLYNRSFVINNEGKEAEHYDKIHLYDVDVPGGEMHNESQNFAYGKNLKLIDTPWGKLGMTVCYDLRFPGLFRALAKRGADFIAVPSAFTEFTGQAHWETLLKARAIENGCYILAPAQTGEHKANRKTHGHSMIIDPWGDVLADGGKEEGFVVAEIDKQKVTEIRKSLPSLQHDREFE